MQDVIFGLVAIGAGVLFCFAGYFAFRLIIPVWGAFVGFATGAGIVTSVSGDGFLRTGIGWIVGLALAVVFALVAYLYYQVAIVIALGSIGFALGTSLLVALDVSWTWLVVAGGLAVALLLAIVAIRTDLPKILLVVLSALGGASAITTGLMLLVGTVDSAGFGDADTTERVDAGWWWYAIYAALALTGVVMQARSVDRLRASAREAWA
jgi:hypothetical protein